MKNISDLKDKFYKKVEGLALYIEQEIFKELNLQPKRLEDMKKRIPVKAIVAIPYPALETDQANAMLKAGKDDLLKQVKKVNPGSISDMYLIRIDSLEQLMAGFVLLVFIDETSKIIQLHQ